MEVRVLPPQPSKNPYFLSNSDLFTHSRSLIYPLASGFHPVCIWEDSGNEQIPSGAITFSLGGIFLFCPVLGSGQKAKTPGRVTSGRRGSGTESNGQYRFFPAINGLSTPKGELMGGGDQCSVSNQQEATGRTT